MRKHWCFFHARKEAHHAERSKSTTEPEAGSQRHAACTVRVQQEENLCHADSLRHLRQGSELPSEMVAKGGHPSDISNMQLAHMSCNRQKSDKLTATREVSTGVELVSNRALPLTYDWKSV